MPSVKGFSNTGSFTAGMLGREGVRRTMDAQFVVDRSAKSASAAADEAARRQSRQTAMSAAGDPLRFISTDLYRTMSMVT